MKVLLKVVIILSAAFVSVNGQDNGGPNEPSRGVFPAFDLGGKLVKIPAPANFAETMSRYPQIAGRLIASESPLNDVLAAHIDAATLPMLNDGGEPDIPYYTKVSVPKHLRSADVSLADFRALAAELKRQPPLALQATLKKDESEADARLSGFWGMAANMKVGETRTIGHFNEQDRVISSLFVTNSEAFGRRFAIIGSMSLVLVNDRLIFLYVFRTTTDPRDQEDVIGLTKSWTARTIEANR